MAYDRIYTPAEVKIIDFFRFEGDSNPEDSSIVYAVEAISGERGLLIDAYGAEGDINLSNFVVEVKSIHKEEHSDTRS